MTVNPSTVQLQNKNIGKLKNDVVVTISGLSGYCVGLTLQYDTGAPNNQWVRNFGPRRRTRSRSRATRSGTELWTTGTHVALRQERKQHAAQAGQPGGDELMRTHIQSSSTAIAARSCRSRS